MPLALRLMIGWRGGAGLAVVVILLALSLHPIVAKIRRRSDRPRSGTLEILSDGNDAKFEIIAVHGLGADPDRTWTQAVERTQEREAAKHQPAHNPARIHLLQDLLKSDFPEARILSFKHNSNWLTDAPVKTTEEIGKSLLEEIKAKRLSRHLPIIFIGHSLGGIIIKQALCRHDSEKIINNTSGIIFLGTPHQGSSVSNAAAALAFVTGFLGSDTTLLLSLRSHEGQLSNLAEKFRHRTAQNEDRRQKVPIISFYEMKPIYLLGWLSMGLVVSRDSAVVHADDEHGIDTNHSGLNKCAGPEDKLYTKLKEAIGRLRAPSLLEQADTLIRNNHYTPERLKIERLSGDLLSMDQCYINLAIVEQSGQDAGRLKEGDPTPSPFSLFARQKVETPDKTIQIKLATIFNQRKGHDGRTIEPRRILIRGRAGVGKTTLCKKMVYDFTRGTQTELYHSWTALFDRLLWVPLRNLKGRSTEGYNHENLFYHEYFSGQGHDDGRRLAKELWLEVKETIRTSRGKTLFVLDGLDEVSHDLDRNDDMSRFLKDLLDQPNVIITSRPNANLPVGLRDLDLELETIGFYPDQVEDYIEKTFTDPKTAETDKNTVGKVQSFLQGHWLIQGLVRVPIQLDALCYTWEGIDSETMPDTMTGIYKAIERRLWKKDAVRLGKMPEGQAQSARSAEIERSLKIEIELLECLAFNGLHSDVIDFTPGHRDNIVNMFPPLDLTLDETLARLSFLRTSDPSSKAEGRNYHFLHLTFQEYFAARYFVRQWMDQKKLEYIFEGRNNNKTNPSTHSPIYPAKFIGKYKYSVHYDVFWRFVAGLLEAEGEDEILRFFNTIEEEPLDLLGPTHQRLVMHCLSEVDSSTNLPIRSKLEAKLSQWMLFECDLTGSSLLARESECPDQALRTALATDSGHGRVGILKALQHPGRHLSEVAVAAAAARLKDDKAVVRRSAAEALGGQSSLPEAAVTALVALLKDDDADVQRSAADTLARHALERQSSLPEAAVTVLVALLKDNNADVRCSAARALGGQSSLPEAAVTALVALLKDDNTHVRRNAADALGRHTLGRQSSLPEAAVMALVALLKDDDAHVRCSAADALGRHALGRQLSLPEAAVTALVALLKDNNADIRRSAARALGRQSSLPEKAVMALVALLKDDDTYVRYSAADALGRHALRRQSSLPEAAVTATLVALLKDDNTYIRCSAADALKRQSSLPEAAVTALVALLKDDNAHIRYSAARALGGQSSLPEAAVTALVVLLKDDDMYIRCSAADTLGGQSSLPEAAVTVLVALLKDNNADIRCSAARTLGRQSSLPEAAVMALVALLKDDDAHIRRSAADALGDQSSLPEAAVTALVVLLKDDDAYVRRSAADALGDQSSLPEAAVIALVALLKDNNADVRCSIAHVLGRQSSLPEAAVTALVALLKDDKAHVRRSIALVLGGQSSLPEAAVIALVALLKDNHAHIRYSTADTLGGYTLGRQSSLPEAAVTALVALLKDDHAHVRCSAARALGRQSSLPEAAVMALVALLKDNDADVQYSAADTLRCQSSLPEAAVTALVALLKDDNAYIRRSAADALKRQSSLPEAAVTALVALLKDNDIYIRRSAADTLGRQSSLPEAAVTVLVALLKDDDMCIQPSAAYALGGQSSLPEAAVMALVALLKDNNADVRYIAARALGGQSSLPEKAVTALVVLLKDDDADVRYSAADALRRPSKLVDKILIAIGLLLESERTAETTSSTLRNPQPVEFLYGSLLWRSFKEQFSLYIDNGHSSCIINQASGLRTASFEHSSQYDEFLAVVGKGRELWNTRGYKLWDSLKE